MEGEEAIGVLILAVLLIGCVIMAVYFIVLYAYWTLLFISANCMALADKILGRWSAFPPFVSWALIAFAFGALYAFFGHELPKLNRPGLGKFLLAAPVLLWLVCPYVGVKTILSVLGVAALLTAYYLGRRATDRNNLDVEDSSE